MKPHVVHFTPQHQRTMASSNSRFLFRFQRTFAPIAVPPPNREHDSSCAEDTSKINLCQKLQAAIPGALRGENKVLRFMKGFQGGVVLENGSHLVTPNRLGNWDGGGSGVCLGVKDGGMSSVQDGECIDRSSWVNALCDS